MSGPNNKWTKTQVSTTSDANAQTSTQVLGVLNNYPFSGTAVVVCSDGTFLFVGYYSD
jgi:hypothetical protein